MQKRLVSLDIVRGITVAGMILVNNGYGNSFQMLRHAEWNGLSVSDFVFPFFLFIMGVSLYMSLSKTGFKFSWKTFGKVAKRTVLLFAIGIGINWFDIAIWGDGLSIGELRFWAVLQRIALCYFLVAMFALCGKPKLTIPLVVVMIIGYMVVLVFGNGYSQESQSNLLYKVDEWMLGDSHLYHWSAVDPEGLLSTICAMVNTLLGYYCGMKLKNIKGLSDKIVSVYTVGTVLVFAGFLVSFFLPFNKIIWSPSFALVTSGACALLLGFVMNRTDKLNGRGFWHDVFLVFGSNALLLYISSELMAIVFGRIGFSQFLYGSLSSVIPVAELASLSYAVFYVVMNFLIGYPLWKKGIFIKL